MWLEDSEPSEMSMSPDSVVNKYESVSIHPLNSLVELTCRIGETACPGSMCIVGKGGREGVCV